MGKKYTEEVQKTEDILSEFCKTKVNKLLACEIKKSDCPCFSLTRGNSGDVDLVVLMDSSGSMSFPHLFAWLTMGSLEKAIAEKCDITNTVITQLSLDNSVDRSGGDLDAGNAGDNVLGFYNHEEYLKNDNRGSPYSGQLTIDDGQVDSEQGCKGIADIANHFNWKEGFCRVILYISDEWLDGGGDQDLSRSLASIPVAVNAANSNNVTIFTHLTNSTFIGMGGGSSSIPSSHPTIDNHYKELAELTGGQAHLGGFLNEELYRELVSAAVCSCKDACSEIVTPEIQPCISISWGDSQCDSLETDDFEILCISVCNCYSNIAFNNFNINRIEITDRDGNSVANLPDGTPSVQAVPIGPVCFGTIAPCEEGESSCVNRELVINARGAKDGEYQVKLHGIFFDVNFNYHQESCFKFELCKS